ncbi:MAG: 1-deoxy-D-xylulose-5-phosphate reductoisomerase [Armatimonadota bacterium]|jgi:1-deoxy-D-xylulose-5-phosphate reductoisomerase
MSRKRIIVLGCTGSIGVQALDIARTFRDRLQVVGLAAHRSASALIEQAHEFRPEAACLVQPQAARRACGRMPDGVTLLEGEAGLGELAALPSADLVVGAVSGVAGLQPILSALAAGTDVALANKEPMVAAGRVVTAEACRTGARLLPVDSELSAIFQALQGEEHDSIERVLLTASGGPFAELDAAALRDVTSRQALAHPTWRMGDKVTVDSATLANKGFEVFELRWLFDLRPDQIEVVVHHQSIIHSMVEFIDGSIIAQMGLPDMRLPIQYALFWPERVPSDLPRLNLVEAGTLTFAAPDLDRFPCLRLAFETVREEGTTYPAVLNAANEVAVEAFLAGSIRLTDIPRVSAAALEHHEPMADDSLENVLAADAWAREHAQAAVSQGAMRAIAESGASG